MPKVSVVIPYYNAGRYIDEAVDSILAQTYHDYEIIIVNDGSTDPYSQEKLESYKHPSISVIHQENKKMSAARNTGIQAAKGEYILTLDADDRFSSTFLEKATAILDNSSQLGVVNCHHQTFGRYIKKVNWGKSSLTVIMIRNTIVASALFRKRCWSEVDGYDESMTLGGEDWEFWIRVHAAGWHVHTIPEYLYHYRKRDNSMYTTMTRPAIKSVCYYIYKKHHELYRHHFCSFVREFPEEVRENMPYTFVLPWMENKHPFLYRILRQMRFKGLLPTYRLLYRLQKIKQNIRKRLLK